MMSDQNLSSRALRLALLAISLAGLLVFGGVFTLSHQDPVLMERMAREAIQLEVERKVGAKIDALSNGRIAALAQRALKTHDEDIQRAQSALRAALPGTVASVVADMSNADCGCRKRLATLRKQVDEGELVLLTKSRDQLLGLVESAYASVTQNLLRELRIFSASNALAFAALGLVAWMRGRAALQLALPAFVLLAAVSITGGFYLLGQDWMHTIVFGQYVGLAYTAYLAGVALMLADVVFNRARGTTLLANGVLGLFGMAASAACC
ncbi:hypothetical protein [Ideonella sp.]|uniref:hypothetical protein n=1 Tax=Ideonella sp. TaxID=1929293 RepID=UPI003BB5EB34